MLYSPYRIASLTIAVCNQQFQDVELSKEELRTCRQIVRGKFVTQQRFAEENDDICREEAKANRLSSLYLSQLLSLADTCGVERPLQRAKKDILVELLFAYYDSIEEDVVRFMSENEGKRKEQKEQRSCHKPSRKQQPQNRTRLDN